MIAHRHANIPPSANGPARLGLAPTRTGLKLWWNTAYWGSTPKGGADLVNRRYNPASTTVDRIVTPAGYGWQFTDNTDIINNANAYQDLIAGGAVHSWAVWVYVASTSWNSGFGPVFLGAETVSNAFLVEFGGSSSLAGFYWGYQNTYRTYTLSKAVAAGNLYHFAGTYTGSSTSKLYMNGVEQTSFVGVLGTTGGTVYNLCAGYYPTAIYSFAHGSILDVRIWNRVLSAPEIGDLYAPSTRWGGLHVPVSPIIKYNTLTAAPSFAPSRRLIVGN